MEAFQFFMTIYRIDIAKGNLEFSIKARDLVELKEKFLDFVEHYDEIIKPKKSIRVLPKINHVIPPRLKYRVTFTPKKREK